MPALGPLAHHASIGAFAGCTDVKDTICKLGGTPPHQKCSLHHWKLLWHHAKCFVTQEVEEEPEEAGAGEDMTPASEISLEDVTPAPEISMENGAGHADEEDAEEAPPKDELR